MDMSVFWASNRDKYWNEKGTRISVMYRTQWHEPMLASMGMPKAILYYTRGWKGDFEMDESLKYGLYISKQILLEDS